MSGACLRSSLGLLHGRLDAVFLSFRLPISGSDSKAKGTAADLIRDRGDTVIHDDLADAALAPRATPAISRADRRPERAWRNW